MKYRGLTFDKEKMEHKWVFGMPSYGYETEKITEIETIEAVAGTHFHNIIPESLGEETKYTDKHGKRMYTGDIAAMPVDGEAREFIVERATVDRECVNEKGIADPRRMEIIGTVAERAVCKGESESQKQ